jgi:uncharacterized lipoprotein YbaY
MKKTKRIATALLSASVCLMLAGCFSYTKETPTPAVVTTPPATSSTTTTTTDNGVVQRQHTSTYSYP